MPPKVPVSRNEVFRAILKQTGVIAVCVIAIAGMLGLMMTGGKLLGIHKPEGKDDQNLLQNYIEWYVVFFTLILSFIIGQGWRRLGKVNSEIDREVDALSLLVRTSEMLRKEYKEFTETLTRTIILYIDSVKSVTIEDERNVGRAATLMKEIHECVKDIVKQKRIPDSIKQELLRHYCEAYDARGDRFDVVKQKLPIIVWFILVGVSFIWLWGFVWLEFQSSELNFYISVSTLGSVSLLFFIAWQLDDVRKGRFKMDFSPFDNKIVEENDYK
jgi:hypothetical protein